MLWNDMLFDPGPLVATPGAIEALNQSGDDATTLLLRHLGGDWGELDEHDIKLNNAAVNNGDRILSSYKLADGTKLWIISDAEVAPKVRHATTFLLPSEY